MGYTNFKNGVSSMGFPIPALTKGKVFFVDLESGEDDNSGTIITQPLLTLNTAIGKCSSGRGDHIYVFGKAAITSTIAITNLDNLVIIGIPNSNVPQGNQPRISSTGVNAVTITNSNKVFIDGLRITVAGAYAGIQFAGGNNFQTTIRDLVVSTTSTTGIGIRVPNPQSLSYSIFENCTIQGLSATFATAGIQASGGAISKGNILRWLYFRNCTDAMVLADSREDFIHHCYSTNCTASFAVTGTTSIMTQCVTDVAVTGTAKKGDNTTAS